MVDYDLVAVIPARLGSSRVKEKVFSSVSGEESLLERKIRQLQKVLPSDRVIVNTESEKISEIAYRCGVMVQERDSYFSLGHEATFSEVIQHVISNVEAEYIAWTPFVVPFFNEDDFKASFYEFSNKVVQGEFDSLVSVVQMKDYVWSEVGPLNYEANENHTVSQDLPQWYRVTNGNYMASKKVMLKYKYFLGDKVYLDIKPQHCSIDIDTYDDLKIAQAYYKSTNDV
ncbi:acylneuraminate cytidylyltransferase family protein [Teredinibacter franksiae]|uniref:acylneuraminate cytidylyltransferase family protein n=1 Tax=Teredinibacter franksiae TaxID=2761453 RepID=UPI001625365F|nr:acylneuraminate cytidylyltransferase [Teredinibacter franksiae]